MNKKNSLWVFSIVITLLLGILLGAVITYKEDVPQPPTICPSGYYYSERLNECKERPPPYDMDYEIELRPVQNKTIENCTNVTDKIAIDNDAGFVIAEYGDYCIAFDIEITLTSEWWGDGARITSFVFVQYVFNENPDDPEILNVFSPEESYLLTVVIKPEDISQILNLIIITDDFGFSKTIYINIYEDI